MKPAPVTRGYTLVEIVIVMGLLGVLLVSLFGSYANIRGVINSQAEISATANAVMTTLNTMSHDMHNMYFEPWNPKSSFVGVKEVQGGMRSDRITFLTANYYANASAMQTGVYTVWYFCRPNDNGKLTLFRRETVNPPLNQAPSSSGISSVSGTPVVIFEESFAVPLIETVEELRIDYSNNETDWDTEWNGYLKRTLPRYVRVTMKWAEGYNTRSFQFTVRPPVMWE